MGGRTVSLVAAVAALLTASAFVPGGAASASAPSKVLVLLTAGGSPAAVAESAGVTPYRVLTGAVTGFAAVMSRGTEVSLASNPAVVMVSPDQRISGADAGSIGSGPAGPTAADPIYPPVTSYPSFVTTEALRVGVPARAAAERLRATTPVATLDSGIQVDNPDLNVVGGVNCSDESGTSYNDDYGHGTEVAGVLASKDNSFGTVGIAPGAPLYAVKVLDQNDSADDSNVICGINWVAAHSKTVHIVNLSIVEQETFKTNTHDCGRAAGDAVHYAICRATKQGVIFIAAAGNSASNVDTFSPAGYPEVITVSGLSDTDGKPGGKGAPCDGNNDNVFAQFSNYGPDIAVAAVATCIETDYNDGTIIYDDGTSFASPEVAGAVALMAQLNPKLTTAGARTILRATAEHDGSLKGDPIHPPEGVLNVSTLWRLFELSER